jgi:PAS domain S-box-containing protein
MSIKRSLILVIVLLFFKTFFWAQSENILFKHLTARDGLSQNLVTDFCQDKFGFIWIGTDDGLNRYDGYNFLTYKHNPKDTSSIDHSSIRALLVDSKGNLWIGTANGLNLYDRQNDRFIHISKFPKNITIKSIAEDEQHNLWVGSYPYLYYYNTRTGSAIVYLNTKKRSQNVIGYDLIEKIFIDSKKNVWIGTNDGLKLYDKKTDSFIKYYHDENNPQSIQSNKIVSIVEDKNGRLWIGTDKGLDLFVNSKSRPKKGFFVHFQNDPKNTHSIANGTLLCLQEDDDNNLWIGSDIDGLDKLNLKTFDINNPVFTHYKFNASKPTGINNNAINALFLDRQNSLWIGTSKKGINIYNRAFNEFKHISNENNNENSLSNDQVNVFYEDGEYIWIGTDNGLNQYNKKTKTFKRFFNNAFDKNSISTNGVYSIHKDKEGILWIGTWSGGLNLYNYDSDSFSHYWNNPKDSNSISSNNIFSIFEDRAGNMWFGTVGGGLNLFDRKNNIFKHYTINNSNIASNYVFSILETNDNLFWMINSFCLEQFNPRTQLFKKYIYDPKDTTSISSNKIFAIFLDSKQNLWIGTNSGLNLYNKHTDQFKHFLVEDGLPDNSIKSIAEDNSGNLWLGTQKGISKFINAINLPNKPLFKNYTEEDGLQSNEFNGKSSYKGSDGLLYFGGANGYNVFNPDSIMVNLEIPNVVITDFQIFNKKVDIDSLNSPLKQNITITKELVLSYSQSVFSFKFTALNYISPEKNQYAYMLEGFEKNWNYVGNKRDATYTNLSPGTYFFRVKASNNDGIWNETGTSIKIIILPPWWKTWWFKLLIWMIIIVCVTFILLKIVNRIRQLANQSILNERNQLETLINNMPDFIFIKDTKSRFIILNDTMIKFFEKKSAKDFIGKTDYDFFPKEVADFFFNQEQEIIKTSVPLINEEKSELKDGKEIFLSTTKCPIINSKGDTIGLLGIVKNITIQKKAEEEINNKNIELKNFNIMLSETNALLEERQQQIEEQSEELLINNEKLVLNQSQIEEQREELIVQRDQLSLLNTTKDKLFSILAHDLKSPFNTLIGFSQLLLKNLRLYPIEKIETQLNLILDASKQTFDMLNNLLEWSRSQREVIQFNPLPIKITDYLSSELGVLRQQALNKQITIEDKIIGNEKLVNADHNQISTVFRNLISNAIKYSFKESFIQITLSFRENDLLFSVKDSGTGISDEVKENLFKISNIESSLGTNGEKGTGLGLIICADFIAKHGGRIWVESELNKGSQFFFNLPY